MLKILVVGCGGQGAPCASILSNDPEVTEIVLVDINEKLLKKVSDKIGSDKLTTMRVDAGNLEDLLRAAKGMDGIINLTHMKFNANIMEAAYKSGAHYVDTAFDPFGTFSRQLMEGKPLEFDKEFKEAGLSAVITCGGSAGLMNVLTRYACDNFDSLDEIRIYLGGGSISKSAPVIQTWTPGWSPEIALDDYAAEVNVFTNGKYQVFPPFSHMEEYKFPDPVGPVLLSYHSHEEPITMPRFLGKGIKHVSFHFGVNKVVGSLIKLGFARYDSIDVKGVKVAPRDVLLSLVRRPVNTFLTEDESTAVAPSGRMGFSVIEVDGKKDGESMKCKIIRGGTETSSEDKLKMFRRLGTRKVGVAAPAIVGLKMCIQEKIARGIIAPECFDPAVFLKKLADLGYPVEFQEIINKRVRAQNTEDRR